jgi:exonuclease SbcC
VLDNFFKKDVTTVVPPADPQSNHTATPEETQAWQNKIAAAAADDVALLQLAHQAPTVPLKLQAIEALTQESAFKQAMHDFREHDKRLYRAAKSRWQAANAARIAQTEAEALIAAARLLLEQQAVPVNRVVELDQAWAAIDQSLPDAALTAEFADLSARLAIRVRAHGEQVQALTRWLSATENAMAALSASLPGVAQGGSPPNESETLAVALLDMVHGIPDGADDRCREKGEAASRLLALASSVVQRALFLQTLPAADGSDEALEKQLIEQWRAFPEMSEGELHTVLATRFADWRNASIQERKHERNAQSAQERAQRAEQNKQRLIAVEHDIALAEAAQASGHVADLTRLLHAIDNTLKRGAVPAALTQRIEILRAEQRHLQDWQRWGGRQGREQLVVEARALAAQAGEKVAIKPHAEAIDRLRERWKELDKLGGASSQSLWLSFDGALKTAYVPVTAHLDKLKQARRENLAAREQIINTLTALATQWFPAAADGGPSPALPDWRAVSQAIEDAKLAWRKLGPVEHTVPRKSLQGDNAVTARYAAALQAIDAPLKNAHADARKQREQLITLARELATSDVTGRDVIDKVRKLQTQWQSVAKSQPLPRRDENALWAAFKTATDSIFTARDAARAASEAALNAKQQARVDIIERVAALAHAASAGDIKRALSEAETNWRAAPDVPKPQAAKLESRYRTARDAASRRLGELATHAAQARYDALLSAMALCLAREMASEPDAELGARWNDIAHFPDVWKARLEVRFHGQRPTAATTAPASPAGKKAAETLPDTLLNLEVACGIESPEEFHAARQRLKILALKNAMEGRQTTVTTPADIERWLLDAASYPRPDTLSQERLAKIVASVRNRRLV